jgi:membrane-associated phospholipid phosphatase
MTTPLDHQVQNRKGLVRLARIFSNIVSPPVIFAILGLALALQALPMPDSLIWAVIYGFVISLLPILFVIWLLNTGRIMELHMSDTSERHLPYLVGVACGALLYGIVVIFDGPQLLKCLALFDMLILSALGIINTRWLISFHASAISAAWVITGLMFGWAASLIVVPFVIAVVIVRLYLKRHSPAQVAAGFLLGVISIWCLTLLGCFL